MDLAAPGPNAPAPPGLRSFPAPGEVWLSPALADLVKELPADQLGERYGPATEIIGDEAVVHPAELVVVRGHAPGDPVMKDAAKVSSLAGAASDEAVGYQVLALIANVLMVVPLLVFGGAATRLTVARRDQRLAALRLVGASPGQVVAMTVAEAVIVAFAGAVTGTILYGAAVPLLTRIRC